MIESINNAGNGNSTSSSGVTGFTPSQNTASPNNTTNASRLLVDASSTNADAVLQPKGTGAVLAQLPDSTATGGNKRGAYAVDLQMLRGAATQVASGLGAFVGAGIYCTASGAQSVAAGGFTSTASGDYSVVSGGQSNSATGAHDAVLGGHTNVASGTQSAIVGGKDNTSTGQNGCVISGFRSTASNSNTLASGRDAVASLYCERAHASGYFTAQGDCQERRFTQRNSTTTATQTELFSAGTSQRMTIPSDTTWTFSAIITARRTDADNESAGYKIEGVIDNNAGTTALVGTPTVTVLGEDTAAWDVVAEADNTNDALVLKVTGEAAKTIRWGATVLVMQITG